jgi:hypothetical protein
MRRASSVRADGYSLPPWMTITQAVSERATIGGEASAAFKKGFRDLR